jgi:hypothetical protein
MTKRMYLWLCLCCVISAVTAQNTTTKTEKKQNVSFGFRLGTGLSDVYYEKLDVKPKLSALNASVFVDIPLSDVYFISIAAEYARKGRCYRLDTLGNVSIIIQPTYHYLQIPVYFSYQEKGLRADFGGYVGRFIKGTNLVKYNGETVFTQKYGANDVEYIKRYDAGLAAQLGYSHRSGIEILLQSQLGLIQIERNFNAVAQIDPNKPNPLYYRGRNFYLGISIGYKF